MTTIRTVLFLVAIFFLRNGEAQTPTDSTYNSTASLMRGCYASVQEFLTNSPSIVDSFYVEKVPRYQENWEGTFKTIPRYASNYRKVKKIWGYCDGSQLFVLHQDEFFVIRLDSTSHYFDAYELYNSSPGTTWGIVGGAVGGAIANSVAVGNAQKEKVRYTIHKETGWLLHPDPEKNPPIPVETLVFYRELKKESIANFSILVNDTLEMNFVPNSYHEVKLKIGTPEVKICQGTDFGNCEMYPLNLEGLDYFKVSIPEKSSVPEIIQVSESEGEYYSFKAMKAQKKRNK